MFNRKKRRIEELETQVEAFKLDSDTWKKLYEEILAKYLRATANITNIHAESKPEEDKKYTYLVAFKVFCSDFYIESELITLDRLIKKSDDLYLFKNALNKMISRGKITQILSFQLLEEG